MSDIQEIAMRHAAKRYAEMMVTSAAADERVGALEKALEGAEYLRSLAEMQLSAATWPEGVGQIIHVGTDEPSDDVYAVLDIYGGQIYRRDGRSGDMWIRAEVSESGSTRYAWPISDAGPFLKLQDEWYVRKLIDAVKESAERSDKLRNRFRNETGYYPEGQTPYSLVDPVDGAIRAYAAQQSAKAELWSENVRLKSELDAANRELEMWHEKDTRDKEAAA